MARDTTWKPEQPLPQYADKPTAAAIITHLPDHFTISFIANIARKRPELNWDKTRADAVF